MVALIVFVLGLLVDLVITPVVAAPDDVGLQCRAGLRQTLGDRDVRGAVAIGLLSDSDANPVIAVRGTRVQANAIVHRLAFELSLKSDGTIESWRVNPSNGERLQRLEYGDDRPMLMVAGITEREILALLQCTLARARVDKPRRALEFSVGPGGLSTPGTESEGTFDGPAIVRASLIEPKAGVQVEFAGSSGDAVVTWAVQPVRAHMKSALELKVDSRAGLGEARWWIAPPVQLRGGRRVFFAEDQWSDDAAIMDLIPGSIADATTVGSTGQ